MKRNPEMLALAALASLILALPAGSAMVATSKSAKPGAHAPARLAAVAPTKAPRAHAAKIDVNTATKEQLMQLPGVDATVADRIVADRPFTSKWQLVTKKAVSAREYAKLAGRVTVAPTAKKKAGA